MISANTIQSQTMLRRRGSTRISAMQISGVWIPAGDRVYPPLVCKADAKRFMPTFAVGLGQ
jgi:hypothetical protein